MYHHHQLTSPPTGSSFSNHPFFLSPSLRVAPTARPAPPAPPAMAPRLAWRTPAPAPATALRVGGWAGSMHEKGVGWWTAGGWTEKRRLLRRADGVGMPGGHHSERHATTTTSRLVACGTFAASFPLSQCVLHLSLSQFSSAPEHSPPPHALPLGQLFFTHPCLGPALPVSLFNLPIAPTCPNRSSSPTLPSIQPTHPPCLQHLSPAPSLDSHPPTLPPA